MIDGFDAASVPDGIGRPPGQRRLQPGPVHRQEKSIEALQAASGAISATKTAATEANAYKLALEVGAC